MALTAAVRLAKPRSRWARRFYDDEKMRKAAARASPASAPSRLWLRARRRAPRSLYPERVPRAVLSAAAPTRERPAETAGATPSAPGERVDDSRLRRIDWWRLAPTLLTTALAVAYVIFQPRSPDLAAHIFRADLFGREGFTLWNGQWYGGHHTPAYSILSPPLVWLLGPQVTGGLSAIGATACFTELVRRHFGPQRYRWGALWFGLGTASLMFTNRIPFAHGRGLRAGRRAWRCSATGACWPRCWPCWPRSPARSPGLFVTLAGAAYALAARGEGVPLKRIDGAAAGRRRPGARRCC